MSMTLQIEPKSGTAVIRCSGVLRLTDAREAAAALWAVPGWRGEIAVWDFREAKFDISSSETSELASFILANQRTPPPKKIAFVIERNVDFGMARMFSVFREAPGTEFRVFRNYDEALRWAGLVGALGQST